MGLLIQRCRFTKSGVLAAAEGVCDAVARSVVNNGSERFSPETPTKREIVNELMRLVGQPDRASTSQIITEHYNDARSNGECGRRNALSI